MESFLVAFGYFLHDRVGNTVHCMGCTANHDDQSKRFSGDDGREEDCEESSCMQAGIMEEETKTKKMAGREFETKRNRSKADMGKTFKVLGLNGQFVVEYQQKRVPRSFK